MKFVRVLAFAAPLLHPTTATIHTPAPMLTPAFPNCEQFNQAVEGETCESMASKGQIPFEEFIRLNPGLNGDAGCHSGNIVPGYWYCLKASTEAQGKQRGHKPAQPQHSATPMPPKQTEDPMTKELCDWGSCWKSWVEISTASEAYVLESATRSCERLATSTCNGVADMDFPTGVKEGCDSCEKLVSGCSCMTEGMYHTYTVGFAYDEPGKYDDYWVDPGMKRDRHEKEEV